MCSPYCRNRLEPADPPAIVPTAAELRASEEGFEAWWERVGCRTEGVTEDGAREVWQACSRRTTDPVLNGDNLVPRENLLLELRAEQEAEWEADFRMATLASGGRP